MYQPHEYYNPDFQNESKEISLVSQTNPDKVLFEIEMKLRGKKPFINEQGEKEWIVPDGCYPLVNDSGINSFMTDASAVINQNTIMSNLKEDRISAIIISLSDTIINKIAMNWKEFNIKKSDLDTIHNCIIVPSYMALNRAMNEGEKRFLKTSVRAVESFTTNTKDPHSGSTSDKVKFWRD